MGSTGRPPVAGESGGFTGNTDKPRRIWLNDINASTANRTSDVLDKNRVIDSTGRRFTFKEGTKITDVEVFAGKGVSKPFQKASAFARKFGGKPSDWRHMSGVAVVTDGTEEYLVEVHWFARANDNRIRDAYIKKRR